VEQTAKSRIIQKARDLFFQFSYKKVSVDEIANGLGMSKKTIYKLFPGKEEILQSVLELVFHQVEAEARSIIEDRESDFIFKLNEIMRFMARRTRMFQMPLVGEIQTHFPALWEQIQIFRRQKVTLYMKQLLQEGIDLGLLQQDVDLDLLVHLYVSLAVAAIDPHFLASRRCNADEVFASIIDILFNGVLTDLGRHHFRQLDNGFAVNHRNGERF